MKFYESFSLYQRKTFFWLFFFSGYVSLLFHTLGVKKLTSLKSHPYFLTHLNSMYCLLPWKESVPLDCYSHRWTHTHTEKFLFSASCHSLLFPLYLKWTSFKKEILLWKEYFQRVVCDGDFDSFCELFSLKKKSKWGACLANLNYFPLIWRWLK